MINNQLKELARVQSENPENNLFFSYCAFNQVARFSPSLVDIENSKIDWSSVYPEGMTSLYDAIGESIDFIKEQAGEALESKDSDVVMLVLTDGHENSSKKYSGIEIKEMIQAYELTEKWNFLFLGAGIKVTDVTKDLDRGSKNSFSFAKSDFHSAFSLVSDELEDFVKVKSQGQKKKNFFEKRADSI